MVKRTLGIGTSLLRPVPTSLHVIVSRVLDPTFPTDSERVQVLPAAGFIHIRLNRSLVRLFYNNQEQEYGTHHEQRSRASANFYRVRRTKQGRASARGEDHFEQQKPNLNKERAQVPLTADGPAFHSCTNHLSCPSKKFASVQKLLQYTPSTGK